MSETTPPRLGRNPLPGCPTRARDMLFSRVSPWGPTFRGRYQKMSSEDCWPWGGYVAPNGYGRFNGTSAHRIAWVLRNKADLTDGDTVDHLCFNRSCVNPRHLERVTAGENVRRARLRQHGVLMTREQQLARKREQMRGYRARGAGW